MTRASLSFPRFVDKVPSPLLAAWCEVDAWQAETFGLDTPALGAAVHLSREARELARELDALADHFPLSQTFAPPADGRGDALGLRHIPRELARPALIEAADVFFLVVQVARRLGVPALDVGALRGWRTHEARGLGVAGVEACAIRIDAARLVDALTPGAPDAWRASTLHAGCLFALARVVAALGVTPEQFAEAVVAKLDRNRRRTWKPADASGVIEHATEATSPAGVEHYAPRAA